jgi:hypothetical protein
MESESGISSTVLNKAGSGATGLIQFMPATARGLGTSTEALAKMSAVEQLDYVEKYLRQAKSIAGIGKDESIDGGTLYALVFMPAHAKKDTLAVKGSGAYMANSGLDLNGDNRITAKDLQMRMDKKKADIGLLA